MGRGVARLRRRSRRTRSRSFSIVALQLSGADLSKLPPSRGVAAITFGGGSGVLSADQCDRAGLSVPPLSAGTRAALDGIVPPLASTRNPVDLTPQTYLDRAVARELSASARRDRRRPGRRNGFLPAGPMSQGDVELAETIAAFRARCPKPASVAWPLASTRRAKRSARTRCTSFRSIRAAYESMGRLGDLRRGPRGAARSPPPAKFDWAAVLPAIGPGEVVTEDRCHAFWRARGSAWCAAVLQRPRTRRFVSRHEVGNARRHEGDFPTGDASRGGGSRRPGARIGDEDVRERLEGYQGRAASQSVALDGHIRTKDGARGASNCCCRRSAIRISA